MNSRLPAINNVSLEELQSEYKNVMVLLRQECETITDYDLNITVTFGYNNDKTATIRWGLWHIADHSRYHQAHINLLKRWYKEANA